MDPLDQVVAFRAFDLRDRFPQPFQTFCQALEALQSDTAYLPQWSGSISAYLKDGRSIEIPYSFFIVRTRRFETPDKAEAWVRDRLKRIEEKGGAVQAFGLLVTNPNDPLDKQIEDAYDTMDSRIVSPDRNEQIDNVVADWLRQAIRALPSKAERELLKGMTAETTHADERAQPQPSEWPEQE